MRVGCVSGSGSVQQGHDVSPSFLEELRCVLHNVQCPFLACSEGTQVDDPLSHGRTHH